VTSNNFSRREFVGILGGISLTTLLMACGTTKTSDQAAEKKKLADLRATKKYKEKKIEIGDNYFSPKETKIDAGTIVVWTHIGRSIHDVMSDDSDADHGADSSSMKHSESTGFASDTLRRDDIFVVLFEEPGTYYYHCHFHGGPKRGQYGSIKVNSTDRTP